MVRPTRITQHTAIFIEFIEVINSSPNGIIFFEISDYLPVTCVRDFETRAQTIQKNMFSEEILMIQALNHSLKKSKVFLDRTHLTLFCDLRENI